MTPAPRLGLGAWGVGGGEWGAPGGEGDEAVREATVRRALERGITFFDTAPTYGRGTSEILLGRALRPHRDAVAIATKVGPRDDPRASLEASLRRLATEYVDLVQVHEAQERWEWVLDGLQTLREEGKALAIGLCNATHMQIARALEIAPIATYQGAYNLFDRDVEHRELPLCRERGLGFLAYRPLASGLLTGKYGAPPEFPPGDHRRGLYWFKGREFERRRRVIDALRPIAARLEMSLPALALAWVLSRPGVSIVLAGARSPGQLDQNLAATGPLAPDTVAEIDTIVAAGFPAARAGAEARARARDWGERERFIVERLDGTRTAEQIAAEWTDGGAQPMVAAQVKVFTDQLAERGLLTAEG